MVSLFKKHPVIGFLSMAILVHLIWFLVTPIHFKKIWAENPLIAHMLKEHELIQDKAKVVGLSYYLPYFPYFADLVSGVQAPSFEKMESYFEGKPYIFHTYYEKAVNLFPDNFAGHYLLAFCKYYRHYKERSVIHFEKSLQLNPYFFWGYYNLGIIYLESRDYAQSAKFLTAALKLNKMATLEIIHQTPFYRQIWKNLPNPPLTIEQNLDQGLQDAMLLLAVCYLKAGAYPQALEILQASASNSWHQELQAQLHVLALHHQAPGEQLDRFLSQSIPVRLF